MQTITITNDLGETIEIGRAKNGQVMVRHSDIEAQNFGKFLTCHELVEKVVSWVSLEKAGVAGLIFIDDEEFIVGTQDVELIMAALTQLE